MNRELKFLTGILVATIILCLAGLMYGITSAQDTYTLFSPTCVENLSPVHYRLHFGYTSSGGETFTVSTFANVSIGDTITTELGTHELGYLDAYSTDSMVDNVITFTGDSSVDVLHLNTWDITSVCEVSSVLPDATPEPLPDENVYGCPAWAIDSASGQSVCLWSLPHVGDYQ